MKKVIICGMLVLSLVGCSSKQETKPYYMLDGRIYECEIIARGSLFPKIRYLKDGEWIYETAYDSDIVYLLPEDVR